MCEQHEKREAVFITATACCQYPIFWCANCALETLDFIAARPTDKVHCKHCEKRGIDIKDFLETPSR